MCTTSTPGGRVSQLRFGAADFISTRPLLAGLTKNGSFLQFESPAALVDSLLRGRYDTALVPAIEYLRGAGRSLVQGPALVGRTAPGGIVLISQKPLEEVERVAVGEYCRTPVAVLRIVLGDFVIEPLAAQWWPPIHAPAGTEHIAGNIKMALLWLLIIWTFAAFGEEISYRGYLTLRAADVGERSAVAFWLATILVSVLFGYGHYYKGPTGILDSSVAGFILGSAYLLTGRNLWTPVLTHGFIDTVGVIVGFFGWDG